MEEKKKNIGIIDIILVIVEVLFLTGVLTVFKACGPKDDGSWMTCHWAGQAAIGVAVVLLIIAIVHMIVPAAKVKLGLALAIIPVSILVAVIPGCLINLCMMDTMRCHTVMRPFIIIMSVITIILSVIDILVQRKKD